jgi:hypothetical protein
VWKDGRGSRAVGFKRDMRAQKKRGKAWNRRRDVTLFLPEDEGALTGAKWPGAEVSKGFPASQPPRHGKVFL